MFVLCSLPRYHLTSSNVSHSDNLAERPDEWQSRFDELLGTERAQVETEDFPLTFGPLTVTNAQMAIDCMKQGRPFYLDESITSLRLGSACWHGWLVHLCSESSLMEFALLSVDRQFS
jgi:hypothetical protein